MRREMIGCVARALKEAFPRWEPDAHIWLRRAKAVEAALAEAGYVIVPREPTEAMKWAAGQVGDKGFCKVIWREMIEGRAADAS